MPSRSKLGQNFLRDPNAVERIVAALGDLSGQTVVEIGPGRGAITGALAAKTAHVIAVEFDRELAVALRSQFPPEQVTIAGQVTVIEQDVLEFDFTAAAAKAGATLCVAGNLPYYITSPILRKLAANHSAISTAVLMVQREVGDRVTASPGSRDYGLLSVLVQMHGQVEPLFTLPPNAFSPPPQVHSMVFRWRFAPRFDELGVEEAGFLRFVAQAFAQKRKTLANNLRAAGVASGPALAAMQQAGIDPQARAESISIPAFAALWRGLAAELAGTKEESS
jgi:16S rRNA (adenine1518-N6/adenine1519-N6)-dimethyltransferase